MMKRRSIILGLVSLVAVLAVAESALAFFWCRKCDRHKTVIICRPYNAFTPSCSGVMNCNGCCPSFCSPCHAPMLSSFQPWCGMPGPSCDPCFGGGACGAPGLPSLPASTPPPPLAGPVTMGHMPSVYQASYQPMYYPNYYPQNYYPGYYPMGYTYPMMPTQNYYGGYYPGYAQPGYGR